MNKKGVSFFEKHIEKIVFAIIGIICVWLLVTRVVLSPNYVEYDNKKLVPGSVDQYIVKDAEILAKKLERDPEPIEPYKPQIVNFVKLMDSAITDVDLDVKQPVHTVVSIEAKDERKYNLPEVGWVDNVAAEHIRTVAYLPRVEVNSENFDKPETYEPGDIDLVTVEGRFDTVELYESFYESFAGSKVKEKWRDPCLAEPVFAAVDLQRQQLLSDGSWGEWVMVPRAKADARIRMFKIVEDMENELKNSANKFQNEVKKNVKKNKFYDKIIRLIEKGGKYNG